MKKSKSKKSRQRYFSSTGRTDAISIGVSDGCQWKNQCYSHRVSNELGANHPKAAKFSVVVATATSAAIGLVFTAVALAARKQMPRLFTGDGAVVKETAKLGYLLAATIFLNSIQPVLSGTRIE